MDRYNDLLNNVTATDAAVALTLMGIFGLKYLLTAFDGGSLYGLGMLGTTPPRKRWVALVAANVVMGLPFILVITVMHVTPRQLWHAAGIWWDQGYGFGWAVAIVTWSIMCSPIMSFIAVFRIRWAAKKQRERQAQIINAVRAQ